MDYLKGFAFVLTLALLAGSLLGQEATKTPDSNVATPDYSGLYGFLQEGEFMQLTVEDHGLVTGFVSRYGDDQGEHRTFVDHFFKQGRLDGKKLTFTTEIVGNISYEFKGTIERGEARKPSDEGYYVVKGTLIENAADNSHKTTSKSQAVVFKSFPREAE